MGFSDRLTQLLEDRGMTAYRLAKQTGLSQSLISDWKNGKTAPNSDKLLLLAHFFGVSTDYLLDNTVTADGQAPSSGARVPVLEGRYGGQADSGKDTVYEFANVRHPDRYFYLRVADDSMAGAGIFADSLVLIREQGFAESGQLVAYLTGQDTVILRRYQQKGEMVALMPENSAYEPLLLRTRELRKTGPRVLGVAVSLIRKL